MKNISSQFKQTRDLFAQFTGISGSISYEDWATKPEDMKAAILFVNFFDQITLAWYKEQGEHTYEEDAVDEAVHICSKLCGRSVKQVRDIKDKEGNILGVDLSKTDCGCAINKNTFTPAYIFNAMRNAFSSLNYERTLVRSTYRHPDDVKANLPYCQNQYFKDVNGDEQDIFSTVGDMNTPDVEFERKEFWMAMEDKMSTQTEELLKKLMSMDDKIVEKRHAAAKEQNKVKKAEKLLELKRAEIRRDKYRAAHAKAIMALQNSMNQFANA